MLTLSQPSSASGRAASAAAVRQRAFHPPPPAVLTPKPVIPWGCHDGVLPGCGDTSTRQRPGASGAEPDGRSSDMAGGRSGVPQAPGGRFTTAAQDQRSATVPPVPPAACPTPRQPATRPGRSGNQPSTGPSSTKGAYRLASAAADGLASGSSGLLAAKTHELTAAQLTTSRSRESATRERGEPPSSRLPPSTLAAPNVKERTEKAYGIVDALSDGTCAPTGTMKADWP
eukprot:scaffold7558_cov109-Isochrysis_galbana.AAC.8